MIGIATWKTRVGSICVKLKRPTDSGSIANGSAIRDSSCVSKPKPGRTDSAAYHAFNCRDVPTGRALSQSGMKVREETQEQASDFAERRSSARPARLWAPMIFNVWRRLRRRADPIFDGYKPMSLPMSLIEGTRRTVLLMGLCFERGR